MKQERKRGAGPENAATVRAILDAGLFATVTYASEDDTPVTIPTNFVRIDDFMYFHGKTSSELIHRMSNGEPVSVNVTIVRYWTVLRYCFDIQIHTFGMCLLV
jgi:nitroimidazol reductase NimA-like FMN-containing flavoprotein (pyridoxamine 5'-phosphate oxidase superfamily)